MFDVERLGWHIAVAQLWAARHDLSWYNQRFSYNPITARLEPVAFDAGFPYWDIQDDQLIDATKPLALRLLSDRVVFESYYRALQELTKQVLDGSLLADVSKQERRYWHELGREFPLLEHFPMSKLKQRARMLRAKSKESLALAIDNPAARADAEFRANRSLFPPSVS